MQNFKGCLESTKRCRNALSAKNGKLKNSSEYDFLFESHMRPERRALAEASLVN